MEELFEEIKQNIIDKSSDLGEEEYADLLGETYDWVKAELQSLQSNF